MTTSNLFVSLQEAADLVIANPKVRFLLRGEKGIGKSSLERAFSKRLPDYHVTYVDCGNLDLGDVALPNMNHDTKTMTHYLNELFGLHLGKPVVIILDEFTKAPQCVKNMLHPLFEKNKPRIGSNILRDVDGKPNYIVTNGNLSAEGIGDQLMDHTRNRLVEVNIRKPDAEEWKIWASNNGIHPTVIAFADRNPQIFASFTDGNQESNPFIWQPNKQQGAFVSGRSLEDVSNLMHGRAHTTSHATKAAIAGAAGMAFAAEFDAFIAYQDELPPLDKIISDPASAPLPDGDGAKCVLVFNLIERVESKTMSPIMQYVERLGIEWQSVFILSLAKHERKQAIAFKNADFAAWVQKNEDLL